MRRPVSLLVSAAMVLGGLAVVTVASAPAATADPTGAQVVASGNGVYPNVPHLIAANATAIVYATVDASRAPQVSVQPMLNGHTNGAAYPISGFVQQTANGPRLDSGLTLAGNYLAGENLQESTFGANYNIVNFADLSTSPSSASTRFLRADNNYGAAQQFVAASPDGFLYVESDAGGLHVWNQNLAGNTETDLGLLPNADTTLSTSGNQVYPTLQVNGDATTDAGAGFAYPTTVKGADGSVQDNLAYVDFAAKTVTQVTSADTGSFGTLFAGGGQLAWANYLQSFSGPPGCSVNVAPTSAGATVRTYTINPCWNVDGITDYDIVISQFPAYGGQYAINSECPVGYGQCAVSVLGSISLFDGTRTQSTTVNALNATTYGDTVYVAQDGTLGTAGIYSATSTANVPLASAPETLVVASPARPLVAAQVALSDGAVTWSDSSSATGPILSRPITGSGATLGLGSPSTVASSSIQFDQAQGYGLATAGSTTVYAAPPATSGGKDNLEMVTSGGSPSTITTYTDGTPYLQYNTPIPAPLQVSGDNVLYLVPATGNNTPGYGGVIYNTTTATSTTLPAAAAYALSGNYLAALNSDGSVTVTDLATSGATPVVLRPASTPPKGGTMSITGEVAVAGDYVSWLVAECGLPAGVYYPCQGNTVAGFRDFQTMAPATTVLSAPTNPANGATPTVANGIAQSADYLLVDESNVPGFNGFGNNLVAVYLGDGTQTVVSTSYVQGLGKYAVDGLNVAWIDASGKPMIAYLPPPPPSTFVPMATTRVFDSGVKPSVGTTPVPVQIAGVAGIPDDATAVVVNTEVYQPSASGYVRVTPYQQDAQVAVQEFGAGQAISNLATVKLNQGQIQVKVSAGVARILMDVSGYYTADGTGSALMPMATTRVYDSGTPSIGTTPVAIQIAGEHGIPADATAVVVNTEVYRPSAAGYVRVTPYNADAQVAVQEFRAGQTISNLVIVQLVDGKLQVKVNAGVARILMDVSGYFTSSGSLLRPISTIRMFDSGARPSIGTTPVAVQIAGVDGIPADATAVVVNTEVYAPSVGGYVRVTPYNADAQVAVQEYTTGQTISNLVVVQLTDGKLQVKVSAGMARILMDVSGYYVSS